MKRLDIYSYSEHIDNNKSKWCYLVSFKGDTLYLKKDISKRKKDIFDCDLHVLEEMIKYSNLSTSDTLVLHVNNLEIYKNFKKYINPNYEGKPDRNITQWGRIIKSIQPKTKIVLNEYENKYYKRIKKELE